MDEIILWPESGRDLDNYDPTRHRITDAAIDFGIEEARRIKDWPLLENAVDAKIAEQRRFVAWWKANVSTGMGKKGRYQERGTLAYREAEAMTGMQQQRVSDLSARLTKPDTFRERLLGAGYHAAMLEAAGNVRGTQGTGENEWYTPAEYVELGRQVLGTIDLDPATTAEVNERVVRANKFYTETDNGLLHDWNGNIWLNPPYAQPAIQHFAEKTVAEWRAGHINAGVVLTHNYTDTSWFQTLAGAATAICFKRGRIRFEQSDGVRGLPTQGQAFFYFGSQVDRFAAVFIDVGFVVGIINNG